MAAEQIGWMIFAAYCLIGLPVVFWHIKRERISKNDAATERDFNAVILLLAVIWPVLLLAIGASWIGEKMDKRKEK